MLCNWLLGLSAISWGVRVLLAADPGVRWTVVPLTLCALNSLAGLLFCIRSPLRVAAGPWFLAVALPSFLLGGLAMRLSPEHPWPYYVQALFGLGGALTIWALGSLGRSFAILPGVREVVVRGPYRLVRHPAYAGECLMLLAACLASWSPEAAFVSLSALALLVVRILAEEATLLSDADYREYARLHRWRLVPGVW